MPTSDPLEPIERVDRSKLQPAPIHSDSLTQDPSRVTNPSLHSRQCFVVLSTVTPHSKSQKSQLSVHSHAVPVLVLPKLHQWLCFVIVGVVVVVAVELIVVDAVVVGVLQIHLLLNLPFPSIEQNASRHWLLRMQTPSSDKARPFLHIRHCSPTCGKSHVWQFDEQLHLVPALVVWPTHS